MVNGGMFSLFVSAHGVLHRITNSVQFLPSLVLHRGEGDEGKQACGGNLAEEVGEESGISGMKQGEYGAHPALTLHSHANSASRI